MASDSLNQVGKYIRKAGKDSDRSLKRAYPIQPRLERVRDVFDSTTEFEMQFDTTDNDKRVLLDLNFTLPPPARGCKAGCIITNCEEFSFGSGGGHAMTLNHSYLAGSISAFVNGNVIPSSQINELNPGSGEVFVNIDDGGTVAICYVYSECPADAVFPECPALESTIGLTTILFSDRFDRTPGPVPYGGVGYWYTNDTLVEDFNEAATLQQYGGAVLLETPFNGGTIDGIRYVFENIRGNGTLFEVIFAADFTTMVDTFLFNGTDGALTITSSGKVQIFSSIVYQGGGSSVSYTQVFSTFQSPINVKQKVYIRFLHDGTNYRFRIWPMNESEPDWWFEHVPQVPIIAGAEYVSIAEFDHIGGEISGTGIYLLALQHWGGNVNGNSLWNYGGEIGNSWSRGVCYSEADAGIPSGPTYFGPCVSTTKTLTEFSTYANSDTIVSVHVENNTMRTIEPTFQYKYTWDQFNPNQAYYYGLNQTVVSFMYDYGKGLNAKISGEIKWNINGSTSGTPGNIAMALMGFAYGNGIPSTGADYLAGNSITVANGFENEWVPFTLDVPVVEGHIQWGARIVDEPTALANELGDHTGTLFLPRTAEVVLDFRRLKIESTMAPLGNALPFCPDYNSLAERVQPLLDGFIGPTFDYRTTEGTLTTLVQATSGQEWTLTQLNSNRVELNGSFKTLYRAKGLTSDGSDGRAPDTDGIYYNTVSRSTSSSSLTLDASPPSGGNSRIEFKFKFATVGEGWLPTAISDEIDPSALSIIEYPRGSITISDTDNISYFHMRTSPSPIPTENYLLFDNTISQSNTLLPNVQYSMIIELTDTYRAKIWRTGDTEPSAWLVEFKRTNPRHSGIVLSSAYLDYIDDDFYTEIFELSVKSIEPNAVPGEENIPPVTNPPPVIPPVIPPPPVGGGSTPTVTTIAQLKAALADNANTEIILQDGTYVVSGAPAQASNSLYIGNAYASRTNHVTVRPQTPGGVTFSGGGSLISALLMFQNGACYQTWDGFNFANAILNETGTVIFGGDPDYPPPHDITMINTTFESSLHRNAPSDLNAHALYFAHANGRGPYNILVENTFVDGTDALCLWAAIHGFHGNAAHPPGDNITIRNTTIQGTIYPIVIWYNESGAQTNNWLIDGATISNAQSYAIRFESTSAHNFVMKNITSTGSGSGGFYSSLGTYPNIPGCTFINNSLG